MALTARQAQIRSDFERTHGTWDEGWQSVLELDPEFLSAYDAFAAVPRRQRHLDAKTQAFVGLAVDAATTHLHAPGILAEALQRLLRNTKQRRANVRAIAIAKKKQRQPALAV